MDVKHGREIYHRRSIRLRCYDYSQAGAYFITICTQGRGCLLGTVENDQVILNKCGQIVSDQWSKIAEIGAEVQLGEYVVMPNHFHGIAMFTSAVGAIHESPLRMTRQQRRNMGVSKIVGRFKMVSAKGINAIRNTPGVPVWQRNYYEHIIRNDADYERIAEYIENNPRRWDEDSLHPKAAGGVGPTVRPLSARGKCHE